MTCDRCGSPVEDDGTCRRVTLGLEAAKSGGRADDLEVGGDAANGYWVRCRIPKENA